MLFYEKATNMNDCYPSIILLVRLPNVNMNEHFQIEQKKKKI